MCPDQLRNLGGNLDSNFYFSASLTHQILKYLYDNVEINYYNTTSTLDLDLDLDRSNHVPLNTIPCIHA